MKVVRTIAAVAASHILAVLSSLPVSTYFPSGEKATLSTISVCPLKIRTFALLVAAHSLAFLSMLLVNT